MKKLANQIIVVDANIGGVKKCDMRFAKSSLATSVVTAPMADGDLRQLW